MQSSAAADQANSQLVDRLIAEGSLWSLPVIAAFRDTPRHRFLDRVFVYQRKRDQWREVLTREFSPEALRLLYTDRALITGLSHFAKDRRAGPCVPISSSSQPSLMAQMLQDLQLQPGKRVLEVGSGTGYNAALLAHLVGPGLVTSIDVDRDVLSQAWDHLRPFAERGVKLHHADGRAGFAESAPYDRIMVTASSLDLEPAWLEQLTGQGLVLAPLILAPGLEFIVCGSVQDGVFHGRLTRAAYFMPLRAEDEAGPTSLASPSSEGGARGGGSRKPLTVPAPWAGWFDRKRLRLSWLGLSQSLGFFALLRGLEVHCRTLENGQCDFGISEQGREVWCWLGAQNWEVSGEAGRDLGDALWRAFLDAGGPWPTEFQLQACPHGGLRPRGPHSYVRQGPRCQQRWDLCDTRERPAWL